MVFLPLALAFAPRRFVCHAGHFRPLWGDGAMTNPSALPPHQDPTTQADLTKVTIVEHVTTLISALDRRFDTLHQDLKEDLDHRFDAVYKAMAEADLRYQQRFDQQQKALEAALAAAKEAVATALTAAEKATTKAEVASERRFESVNEFRGQLADQAANLMPRSEAEARFVALSEKVDELKNYQAATVGSSAGKQQYWGWLLGAIGGAATLISIVVVIVNLATSR
jgi:hypothetical protein